MNASVMASNFAGVALLAQADSALAQQGSKNPAVTTNAPGRSPNGLASSAMQDCRSRAAPMLSNGFIVGASPFDGNANPAETRLNEKRRELAWFPEMAVAAMFCTTALTAFRTNRVLLMQ